MRHVVHSAQPIARFHFTEFKPEASSIFWTA